MRNNLLDCEALFRVLFEHSPEEVFDLRTQILRVSVRLEVELFGASSLNVQFLVSVGIPEGKLGSQQRVCKGAETVDVDFFAVLFGL